MTRIDESYPPLEPTVSPLPTEGTLIEPQQAGIEQIAPDVETTVTTTTEMQTATSPWSRDQGFGGHDAPVTDAESQVPGLSKKYPETDPRDLALPSEDYGIAETNKSVTGLGEELPQASGSTPETADKSTAKPEVRPRASRRLPPTPPYYWNRPYRPYGPYGTYGGYPTYSPATPPHPYGYRFVNPRQKDTK